MKYLSIQTFQCGISVSGAATFTGGATINLLALNGATTSSEASLFLGAHGTLEGGQLVLQKGTSQTYAAHLDNYSDQFRVMYGTNTGSTGVALGVNLATGQLNLPFYTTTTSFSGTVVGYLAFDSTGKVITTSVPAGGVTSIIAGTGVTVSSGTGNVTVSIGQSVATSATPSFDQVYLTNNGNGTNVKIGDDAWIGDINASNTFRVMGQQNNANGYIVFGNANTDALGRSGTGNLTYAGSTVWTASTLTNLNQLTNGPGYITAAALAGYVPTSRILTINGTSYDLSADRSWTITTPYVSKLQHAVKAGVAINKGQAVYVTSADGTNMIVGLASNASEATSSKTMGLLDATVSTNGFANVVTEGLLAGLNTSTANAEGDPVWLGTGGNLIYGLANKPYAPAHLVFIGIVTRKNASNGEIFVKVQNGFELEELHNVDLFSTTPINNHLLAYDYATSLWKNKTLGTVIGGVTSQYVKGDGTLGSFPSIGGGGGVVYYLNGGVASGVGGYQQMSTAPVLGAGTDFSLTGNGLVCQFLTDANSPSLTLVPPGAWRIGVYASMGTSANNSKFYIEILKYNGSTFTAIGSSVASPESIVNGTNIEYYTTTVAVSSTVLTITDRIAIRIYAVDNLSKTMTIHTENGHLCDIATTFPSGLSSINGLTDPSQLLVVGSSGSDFNIISSVDTHTFNIPTASASNRGLLSAANWTTFNSKQDALTNPITGTGTTNYLSKFTGSTTLGNSLVFDNGTNVGIGTVTPDSRLHIEGNTTGSGSGADAIVHIKQNGGWNGNEPWALYVEGYSYLNGFRVNAYDAQRGLYSDAGELGFAVGGNSPISFTQNTSDYRMYIAPGGNIGIGTTSPSYKLQVNADGAGLYVLGANSSPYNQIIASFVYGGNGNSINIENQGGKASIQARAGGSTMDLLLNPAGSNVVIGTTTPFTIGGTAKVSIYADAPSTYGLSSTDAVYLRRYGVGEYQFQTTASGGNSGNLSLQSYGGSVGIGTTSPNRTLSVNGIVGISSASANTQQLVFSVDSGASYITSSYFGSSSYVPMYLETGGNVRLAILTNGNLGIGTTAPTNRLQIGSIGSSGYGGNDLAIGNGTQVMAFYQSATVSTWYTNTSFSLMPSGSGSVGNLGVGTDSPTQRVHVSGNLRVTGAFYDSNNQAGTSGQILKSTGSGTDWVSLSEITGVDGSGTANYVTKWSDADTITNSLIYDNGTNVGIGTTSPGYNFDVNGQVRVQDKLRVGTVNSGNGVVHMSSTATINANTTTIVWAQNVSVGMCAFIEYYILNGNTFTDQRAGTIIVTWNQTGTPTIAHTETTTPDIGSTTTINFTSTLVGSDARINAVSSSPHPYTMVMSFKYF